MRHRQITTYWEVLNSPLRVFVCIIPFSHKNPNDVGYYFSRTWIGDFQKVDLSRSGRTGLFFDAIGGKLLVLSGGF